MDPMGYLQQYQKYLMPWYNTGLNDFQLYSNLSSGMAQNPVDFYNNIMNQYTLSPYAQMQSDYISNQVANQAAKGGYLGTPQEMTDLQGNLNRLISQDQQQYYQDVMQPEQMGMGGLQYGSGLGFDATRELGDMFANEAQLAAGMKGNQMSLLGNLLGIGMGGLMKYGLPKLLG